MNEFFTYQDHGKLGDLLVTDDPGRMYFLKRRGKLLMNEVNGES